MEELENLKQTLQRKDELLRHLEDEVEKMRESMSISSGYSSQYSLNDSRGNSHDQISQRNSQDRFSPNDNFPENSEDLQKSG